MSEAGRTIRIDLPMAIPPAERLSCEAILAQYCEKRVPPAVRDKVRMGFRTERSGVVLFEQRPRFDDPSVWIELDIAQFRYVATRNVGSCTARTGTTRGAGMRHGGLPDLLSHCSRKWIRIPPGFFGANDSQALCSASNMASLVFALVASKRSVADSPCVRRRTKVRRLTPLSRTP